MSSRGYDGHFLCNSAHPGKLKESLTKHLLEMLQGETHIPPFFLTTYSHWKDDESPYVQCDFKIKYDHSDGFRSEKMEITHGNSTGKIKVITLPLKGNTDIPYREHANSMVLGRKKKLKI
jgi:hypothetical protein